MTEGTGLFEPGETILLIDQRDRTYLFTLRASGTYHTHSGTLGHDELIGHRKAPRSRPPKGMVFVAFRPRFADYVLKMPRGAQVVYPKDLGPIVTYADIFPGARVLEAGTGSGALTIALVPRGRRRRAGSSRTSSGTSTASRRSAQHRGVLRQDAGRRSSCEGATVAMVGRDGGAVRPCGARHARALGAAARARARCSSRAASSARTCRRRSRCSSSCSPCPAHGFLHIETFETLKRGWHVTERSVRPDHRMVGHTGLPDDRAPRRRPPEAPYGPSLPRRSLSYLGKGLSLPARKCRRVEEGTLARPPRGCVGGGDTIRRPARR